MGLTQSHETAAAKPREYSVLWIGCRSRWPALDLQGLRMNCEQLYFFIWREIETRYIQPVMVDALAILQYVMTMRVFSLLSVNVTNQYSVRLIQSTIRETAVPIGNSL
jgi:hypothetical protein